MYSLQFSWNSNKIRCLNFLFLRVTIHFMSSFRYFNLKLAFDTSYRISTIDKYLLTNSFSLPKCELVTLSLKLTNLESFNSPRVVAAFFLLRYLSGRKPFITKFNIFQTFKKKRYDIHLQINLRNHSMYDFLCYFSSIILPNVPKLDLRYLILNSKEEMIYRYSISDLNFLKLVEMHPIFFR